MRVFTTGATGLVGVRLVRALVARGDEVLLLTRNRESAEAKGLSGAGLTLLRGDPAFAGVWQESVAGCEAVVNLAGENIFARRWSEKQKKKLRSSRVEGTRNLVAAIGRSPAGERPKALVSASAIGYYGPRDDDHVLGEDAHPGGDFLAGLCAEWEEAARSALAHGARVAVLRIGVVLAREDGALARMLPPFKLFMGGPLGSGRQWFSWIHIDDLVGLILFAIDRKEVRGPVNATAPGVLRLGDFCRELGAVLHRPSWLKVPRFALRVLVGEVADVLTLGQRVAPVAAERLGYLFHYPTARPALEAELGAR